MYYNVTYIGNNDVDSDNSGNGNSGQDLLAFWSKEINNSDRITAMSLLSPRHWSGKMYFHSSRLILVRKTDIKLYCKVSIMTV